MLSLQFFRASTEKVRRAPSAKILCDSALLCTLSPARGCKHKYTHSKQQWSTHAVARLLAHPAPPSCQVFKSEFHPTQPWVLSATKGDLVSVWDWNSQEVSEACKCVCARAECMPACTQRAAHQPLLCWCSGVPFRYCTRLWCALQVLHKVQLGVSGEDDVYGDADLARLHTKDASVTVNTSMGSQTTSRWGPEHVCSDAAVLGFLPGAQASLSPLRRT